MYKLDRPSFIRERVVDREVKKLELREAHARQSNPSPRRLTRQADDRR
jgi:hypothetical protein